jgi:hypothetical protein
MPLTGKATFKSLETAYRSSLFLSSFEDDVRPFMKNSINLVESQLQVYGYEYLNTCGKI